MISLDVAKSHLRVDFDDEDNLIELYLKAAIEYAEGFIDRSIITSEEDRAHESDIVVNNAIKSAILLILGHLYANREEESIDKATSPLQLGAKSLLLPYRIKMGV